MSKRGRFGALTGALLLTFALASTALAAAPTYTVDVTKTASVATVPAAGASVTYTVKVTNTGTGDFSALTVVDDKCTLTGGKDVGPSDKFASGEVLTYTCTKTVSPNTTNTATAWACHNASDCNQGNHTATDSASVTVGLTATTTTTTTTKATTKPTAPVTSTTSLVSSSGDGAWLAIIALGVLLASVVILTPRRKKSES